MTKERVLQIEKELPRYTWHPGKAQLSVYNDPTRFKVICAPRRWGKSELACNEVIKAAMGKRNSVNWIVAPVYSQASIIHEKINKYLHPGLVRSYGQGIYKDKILLNGSKIQVKTAVQPDRLRGFELDHCVIDEFAIMDERIWHGIIRPALGTRHGGAMIISTPKGRNNEFFRLFQRGMSGEDKEYKSWHFEKYNKKFFSVEELEEARKSTPALIYAQEYEAKFIDSASTVFHGLDQIITEMIPNYTGIGYVQCRPAIQGRLHFIGVDVGVLSSFTVVCVIDSETGELVAFDRFNRTSYDTVVSRIQAMANQYPGLIILDSTGIGYSIYEKVKAGGYWIEPYLFTNQSKNNLIQHLQMCIEQGKVKIPGLKILLDELEAFEYEITGQKYTYTSSTTTDCVMSLALACIKFTGWMYSNNLKLGSKI